MPPRKKDQPAPVYGNMTDTLGITLRNPPAREEIEEGTPKPDFFGSIQNYFTKQTPVTTDTDSKEVFIQARFLSMCSQGFDAAALYNELSGKLPKWARAVVLYWLTPAMSRAPRMNYIKGEKGKESDAYKEVIKKIVTYFKCKPIHAPQIYALLEAQKFDIYGFFGMKAPRGFLGSTGKEDDDAGGEPLKKSGRTVRRGAGTASKAAGRTEPPVGGPTTGPFARRRV